MITDEVKKYYGKELEGSDDLKTDACCTDSFMPQYVKIALSNVHDEVLSRYYGCGLIAPEKLNGCKVLDLGSGSGRDAYVLSQLVGENGEVVGIDMTREQLDVANKYVEWHREKFGYEKSNVKFIEGQLEKLADLKLGEGTFDVIVSNCVINLCTDKDAVLREAYRLLKPGGEIYFSDVYSDRRVPRELLNDPVLYGECLSGALYINDFESMVKKIGFKDPRIVEGRRLGINNAEIEAKVGHIKFYSVTYRLFKVEEFEERCEDYGQSVVYTEPIKYYENKFILDSHHAIEFGKPFPVCGNTYNILKQSRFSDNFEFRGDFSTHYGIFAGCGGALPDIDGNVSTGSCGCGTLPVDSLSGENISAGCCSTDSSDRVASLKSYKLKELWIHTGTICNLSCPDCLEGSKPGDNRIEQLSFTDAKDLIDEAVALGVSQISFTGGEPFVTKDFLKMLDYVLDYVPALVLTNGTEPLFSALDALEKMKSKKNSLSFRVSIDSHIATIHDKNRGEGNFRKALNAIKKLSNMGFNVSVARRVGKDKNDPEVTRLYENLFEENEIDRSIPIVPFVDLYLPNSDPAGIPIITDSCLNSKKSDFMCEFSRMVVKKGGKAKVYACTLVDDDESFDLGESLSESLNKDIYLKHHRCFSCYSTGASCSEL